MDENFKFEIINPEKILFSNTVTSVTLPSYEGDMSILKNHISIITFLRPGIVRIKKNENNSDEFFVQDGTVEYFSDNLVLLSSSAVNIKNLSKIFLDDLSKDTQNRLSQKDITDHDRYILNQKLDVIKDIRI
tara:strand:- start:217 stop:612 length:396 start_codon:yes stop_codon:yes gene_type:complete